MFSLPKYTSLRVAQAWDAIALSRLLIKSPKRSQQEVENMLDTKLPSSQQIMLVHLLLLNYVFRS
jgi:hypothetical protein